MESELLASAAEAATTDPDAEAMCLATGTGPNLLAAVDSTSGEVREIGRNVNTPRHWDDDLPEQPEAYVAICIYDVAGVGTPIPRGSTYMAQWVTEQEFFEGNGLLTFW